MDYGREFDNEAQFVVYYDSNGITHNFSTPHTPQSNEGRKEKRTLQEMSRAMLKEQYVPQKCWCKAVDTSTYILNRILIRPILGKSPYEILRGRKPTPDYFKICYLDHKLDDLRKFFHYQSCESVSLIFEYEYEGMNMTVYLLVKGRDVVVKDECSNIRVVTISPINLAKSYEILIIQPFT
ncbi:retrovirus-related pol polyprotein from transposon TNT 1-94 [Tanacetum coccineum]|uniref:Retrovirus-related pol polyprotein from transposon TNT 1-94 n=1 Tax=Tanacetum coccineum TaxID=301880 RepID=A0ABQ4WT39_9ASTR